jgi:hypothetical protein
MVIELHLLEILLTGAGIFLGPLMLVAAMGGVLSLLDRFFHASPESHRTDVRPRSKMIAPARLRQITDVECNHSL